MIIFHIVRFESEMNECIWWKFKKKIDSKWDIAVVIGFRISFKKYFCKSTTRYVATNFQTFFNIFIDTFRNYTTFNGDQMSAVTNWRCEYFSIDWRTKLTHIFLECSILHIAIPRKQIPLIRHLFLANDDVDATHKIK